MSDVLQAREWDSPPANLDNNNGHFVPDVAPVMQPVPEMAPPPVAEAPAPVVEAPVMPVANDAPPAPPADPRREQFFAGAGIRFKGELEGSDEILLSGVFEGTARARKLIVSHGGHFSGACLVEEAEIEGVAEGTLTVTGALIVRANGVVRGKISYGEIELARGAHLEGEIVKKLPEAAAPVEMQAEAPAAPAPVVEHPVAPHIEPPVELSAADIVVVPAPRVLTHDAEPVSSRRRFGIFSARR